MAQGGVRDVALVLVELAGREQATRRDQHLVQLVYYRGFADPGITGDEHELQGAVFHDPVEGSDQSVYLAFPAIELLRDQQPVRYVVSAGQEQVDTAMRLPFRQTAPQIGLDACGGLVALLGGLGEEFHHDCRERSRDARDPLVGRGGGEGELPRQHFVKGDAQCIEIAAGVHRAVHPASLFRRHVGERPGDHLKRRRDLALARQTRGNAEPRQPHAAACCVH